MELYVILGAATIVVATGFLISGVEDGYESTSKEVAVGLAGTFCLFMFLILSGVLTKRVVPTEIDHSKCEFAKTSETVFAECGEFQTKTTNHFIYENYRDSSKVGAYKVEVVNDLTGVDRVYLELKKK